MKKILLISLFATMAFSANAQVEFGFQFSPTLSTTRFTSGTEAFEYDRNGAGIRFNGGPVVDIYLRQNIAVSTGLWYSVKRTGLTVRDTLPGIKPFSTVTNTQYIQLPLAFKFFTQEIVAGTRLNVIFGGTADFKIAKDKISLDGENFITDNTYSKFINASLLVGIGGEMKIGSHNKFFANIFYSRGLVNMLTKKFDEDNDDVNGLNSKNLKLNSDQIGVLFGYKF